VTDVEAAHSQDAVSFDQLLHHTRLSLNPMLPSAWLAKSVLGWAEGTAYKGAFYFFVLLANAMFGVLLGFEVMGRFFYGSWSMAQSSRAEQLQRKAEAKRQRNRSISLLERLIGLIRPLSQPPRHSCSRISACSGGIPPVDPVS
jgi:hypothetical protein